VNKKIQSVIVFLLVVASFLGGVTVAKLKYGSDEKINSQKAEPTTTANQSTAPVFVPKVKTAKPEIKFFVMSFCPYGNQAEVGIEPVYQLLKDKVTWTPRYIISKITQDTVTQCKNSCPQRVANDEAKKKCQEAIDAGQLTGTDAETCVKQYFPYQTADECIETNCNTLTIGSLESLHGQQELNQDIREICAYNLGDLGKWWKFVSLVNEKCNSNDADTCWEQQAADAGLDVNKVSSCEKSQKILLADKEIAEAEKYQVSGSPTVLINDTSYNGGRSPEDYKKAICSAFKNPPKECNQILGQETNAATGGCE